MKKFLIGLAFPVAAACVTPSYANARYSGSFSAVITSGFYSTTYPCDGPIACVTRNLTGDLIDVPFLAEFFDSGGLFDLGYTSVSLFGIHAISSVGDDSPPLFQSAKFVGNERAASVEAVDANRSDDATIAAYFTYSGATTIEGPVSGTGSFYYSGNESYHGYPDVNIRYNFTLLSGSVQVTGASAAPEPATWGLMVLGFGITGAAMRSRRRHAVRAFT